MGNTPSHSFRVGESVLSKFDAGEHYYAGKIVRIHSQYAYDVQFFHSGRILTKQWNDIKPFMKPPTPQKKKSSTTNDNFEISDTQDTWISWKTPQNKDNSNDTKEEEDDLDSNNTKIGIIYNLNNDGIIPHTHNAKEDNNNNENKDKIESEFFRNFEKILSKHGTIDINLNNNNNNNKVTQEMSDNFNKILSKIGGNEFKEGLIDYYQANAHATLTRVFQEETNTKYVSKMIDLKVNESTHNNNNNGFGFDLRMDLDFNKIVVNNKDEFEENIKKEISKVLNIDESLILVNDIKAGSVIVTVCIVCGILALVIAGLYSIKSLFFKSKRKQSCGEIFTCGIGDIVQVSYENVVYDAKVKEIKQKIDVATTVKVEYVGKPFMFRNSEVIEMDSDRLQGYPEPGSQIYGQLICSSVGSNVSLEAKNGNEKEGAKLRLGVIG